jgi:hypothetical protein
VPTPPPNIRSFLKPSEIPLFALSHHHAVYASIPYTVSSRVFICFEGKQSITYNMEEITYHASKLIMVEDAEEDFL